MSDSTKHKVFISHSSQTDIFEQEWLRRLADAMDSRGVTPWLDQRDIKPGEPWKDKIDQAIRECEVFLMVVTGDIEDRPNFFFELGIAKALGKKSVIIIPGNHDVSWMPSDLQAQRLLTRRSPEETAEELVATLDSKDSK